MKKSKKEKRNLVIKIYERIGVLFTLIGIESMFTIHAFGVVPFNCGEWILFIISAILAILGITMLHESAKYQK